MYENTRGQQEKPKWAAIEPMIRTVAVISILISVTLAIRYSGQHLLEAHSFRQTQTALSAYWLRQDGFKLAYETPSIGAPWSIPFEFPIYEWLVGVLSCTLHLNLERVGRLLSFFFLLACLWPVAQILKRLFPAVWRLQFATFVPLFLLSPLYLFWGRSFMIETAALYFTLAAAQSALPFVFNNETWRTALFTTLLFTLALLQKSTTALPVWLLLLAVIGSLDVHASWMARIRRLLNPKIIFAFLLPFLIAYAWTRFTDEVKMQNLGGQHLTSSGLAAWNFGSLGMRLRLDLWYHSVWNRVILRNAGGPIGVALIAMALLRARTRERLVIYLSLAAFVLPILIFTNLHFVHDYYQTANGVYLLLAVAIAFAALLSRYPGRSLWLVSAFAVVLAIDIAAFLYTGYAAAERVQFTAANNRTLALAEYLKANTPASAPLIAFGLDWSAELPFYAERRTLGVPNWFTPAQQRDILINPSNYVGERPPAIIFCGGGYDDLKKIAGENAYPANRSISDCEIRTVANSGS